ncbi:MAG: glycosyltransferase [Bacteroidetes bacterium]|nr:glycosyltransferase [Bacteroidota bacterium]
MTDELKVTWVLIPVFNDWISLSELLTKLDTTFRSIPAENVRYLVVDDASNQLPVVGRPGEVAFEWLRLRKNMGHQRAISIGLSYLNKNEKNIRQVIVMDADGEDDPGGIPAMMEASERHPRQVIFASRVKRQEGFSFRWSYFLYKILFRVLTGKRISFGNFSLVPGGLLPSVVNISEIWNHYSGGMMKAMIPFTTVPVARKKRTYGKSSMSYESLVLHGLKSISVYLDRVAARSILFFIFFAVLMLIGVVFVLYFKFYTSLAIPGWTTSALSGLLILLFQGLLVTLFLTFIVLNQNTQRLIIPAIHFVDYVDSIKKFPDEFTTED